MNFTKEEVSLCTQIAEKHWGEICVGVWLYFEEGFYLVTEIIKTPENVDVYVTDFRTIISADDDFFPLWTISDCLEWLRQEYESILIQYIWRGWGVTISESGGHDKQSFKYDGKTPLEACLKAVLAVLEEK